MGCIVNGPGESKHADIGISLPGTGETPAAPVFVDGVKTVTLRGAGIAKEFKTLVDGLCRAPLRRARAGGGIVGNPCTNPRCTGRTTSPPSTS